MGTVNDFIIIIKKKEGFRFDKQVAEHIGVDKHSLANAKLRNKLPNSYIMWYCDNYNVPLDKFNEEIKLTNTDIELEGAGDMEAKYVIELQKDKIDYQNKEIEQLKLALNRKTVENESFDSQLCDCLFDVTVGFGLKGITRTINSITNRDIFTEKLGYSKKEMDSYWDLGVKHKFSDHPIDQIIDKDSREKFSNQSRDLPQKMEAEKDIVGDHFYQMTYFYIHKEGHKVPVNVSAKIHWWERKIICKLNFCCE